VHTKAYLPGKNDECLAKFGQLRIRWQTVLIQIFVVQHEQPWQLLLAFSAQWKF
jgi:hypothetical protein